MARHNQARASPGYVTDDDDAPMDGRTKPDRRSRYVMDDDNAPVPQEYELYF